MTLGQNIKKMRRSRDMTQEELAESMNVSVSAVSQWESGRTAPDISLIPALCALFCVSADDLLGINHARREIEIDEVLDRAWQVFEENRNEEGLDMLRATLRRYPDAYRLMTELASVLCNFADTGKVTAKEAYEEICGYLDKIFADCADNSVRCRAVDLACIVYPKIGRADEAVKLAKSMNGAKSELELLSSVYTGEKRISVMRDRMWWLYNDFQNAVTSMCYEKKESDALLLSDDDRIKLFQLQIKLTETVFEDGDYLFFSHWLDSANCGLAEIYAHRGDADRTLFHLAEAAKYAEMFDTYDPKARYSSVLFRNIIAGSTYRNGTTSCRALLQWCESEPCFAFVRPDGRYAAVVRGLKTETP